MNVELTQFAREGWDVDSALIKWMTSRPRLDG